MKKIAALFLTVIILTSLFSCSASESKSGGISVVTTNFPLYDFARELLGDDAEVTLLLKPGQDAHSYEPSGKDIVKIKNCDLFLCIGGQDERWVKTILSGKDLKNVRSLFLIDHVPLLSEGHTHSDGHDHPYDEHIWISPKKAILMLKKIADELINVIPEHKETIEVRRDTYLSKLEFLDAEYENLVKSSKRDTIVFADRFPFLYLATDYGIKYSAAFPGCSELTEPSAATVASLIELVNRENIPCVFITELSNGKIADSICSQTGAKKEVLHSCANLTKADKENGETYISLMTKNLDELKNSLQK